MKRSGIVRAAAAMIVVLLAAATAAANGQPGDAAPPANGRLVVRIYDLRAVPLDAALDAAERIFNTVGVDVTWVRCSTIDSAFASAHAACETAPVSSDVALQILPLPARFAPGRHPRCRLPGRRYRDGHAGLGVHRSHRRGRGPARPRRRHPVRPRDRARDWAPARAPASVGPVLDAGPLARRDAPADRNFRFPVLTASGAPAAGRRPPPGPRADGLECGVRIARPRRTAGAAAGPFSRGVVGRTRLNEGRRSGRTA